MGNKLGPITSDICMDKFELMHMETLEKLGVKLWFMFVDDTFVVIKNIQQADSILKFLNEQRKTLKFTIEIINNK